MDFQDNQNLIDNKEEKLLESVELILEVKNLTVSFGEEKVVDNLSFNLKKGENKLCSAKNIAGKKSAALGGRIFQNEKSGKRTSERSLGFRGHNGRAVS